MHFSISQEMMREIIMDHYQNPRNKREGDDSYQTIYMDSTSCIDKIYIQIKIVNNVFEDVSFSISACISSPVTV